MKNHERNEQFAADQTVETIESVKHTGEFDDQRRQLHLLGELMRETAQYDLPAASPELRAMLTQTLASESAKTPSQSDSTVAILSQSESERSGAALLWQRWAPIAVAASLVLMTGVLLWLNSTTIDSTTAKSTTANSPAKMAPFRLADGTILKYQMAKLEATSKARADGKDIQYRTEIKTRMVPFTRMTQQTKTKLVPISRTRTEVKTRQVPVTKMRKETQKVEQEDGTFKETEVKVPYTEMTTESYTVSVPYTEQVQQNYTVQVPVTEMREERFAVRVPCKPGEKPDSGRKIVYRDEVRTREVPVQKMRTEWKTSPLFKTRTQTKTRLVPVTKMRKETKKVKQDDGTFKETEVEVPYTEMVQQSYQVSVPYSENARQSVQVPYTDIETQKYSVRVPYYADEAPDVAKGENVSPSKPIVVLFNGQSGRGFVSGDVVGGKSWLAKKRTLDTRTGASPKIRYRLENRTRQVPYTTMTTQTKTRMVPVQRTRTEVKTRQVPVTKMRKETKKVKQEDGTFKETEVEVPYTELVTQSYTVQVPYTENTTQSYTVQVPVQTMHTDTYQVMIPYTVDGDLPLEEYSPINENNFVRTAGEEAISTFSIDVDTAAYSNMRRFINSGQLPPPDAVRIEELVNYFSYDYPQPEGDDPFSVNMELANCPWSKRHKLLRVGIKGKEVHVDERPASNLVFLLDVSGSMNSTDKLPLLKRGLQMMVDQLNENDRVSIVTYAGNAGLVLEPTSGDQTRKIKEAIEKLNAGGSTNGSAGIELAYQLAQKHFIEDGVNKVILATDGDLNVGVTQNHELVELIKQKASENVFLTVLGFGTGNLKDSKMEQLADNGNGIYAYIDGLSEARKVLVDNLSGSLVTIAKDVKLQLEFNPAEVTSYRLIGYENRTLQTEDFNNDQIDAGEIGAGHTVTAIYELLTTDAPELVSDSPVKMKYQSKAQVDKKPVPKTEVNLNLSAQAKSGELLTLALRYKQPDSNTSQRLEFTIDNESNRFESASADFQFAASVASFGMLLRSSQHAGDVTKSMIEDMAEPAIGEDSSGYRTEFLELVRKANLPQRK